MLALAPAAGAAGRIDGTPLDVYADGLGGLQAVYDGETAGAFAAAPWAPLDPQLGRAGLEVAFAGGGVNVLGAAGMRVPIGEPVLTAGAQPGEQVLTSAYGLLDTPLGVPVIEVREEVSYVDDPSPASAQQRVVVRYTFSVPGASSASVTVTPAVLGALLLDRGPQGLGFFTPGTGGQTLGATAASGVSSALTSSATPWSSFQQGLPDTVFGAFAGTSSFPGTVSDTTGEAAVGASWESLPIVAPSAPVQLEVAWLLGRPTARATLPPDPDPPVTPDPDPPDPGPPVVPVADRSVVVVPLRGRVLARLPGSGRYVDVTTLKRLPLGTLLDTTGGRLKLTSAADRGRATQTAQFYGGLFRVGQRTVAGGRGRLVTVLTLAGSAPVCRAAKRPAPKARARAAKAKKAKRLWGDGKGRFSIRGRYSSATVRGTKWVVTDRCDGTLTRVVRGVVAVEDFARRKTVMVKAGRSYLARARR